jgi:hypothetical protein
MLSPFLLPNRLLLDNHFNKAAFAYLDNITIFIVNRGNLHSCTVNAHRTLLD